MPADSWWSVYAHDDGTWHRSRVPGFALVDEWDSHSDRRAPVDDDEVDRCVYPLTADDCGIDVMDVDNFVLVVHADEWSDDDTAAAVADHLRRRAARRSR
jgi:hypothetical protein